MNMRPSAWLLWVLSSMCDKDSSDTVYGGIYLPSEFWETGLKMGKKKKVKGINTAIKK